MEKTEINSLLIQDHIADLTEQYGNAWKVSERTGRPMQTKIYHELRYELQDLLQKSIWGKDFTEVEKVRLDAFNQLFN